MGFGMLECRADGILDLIRYYKDGRLERVSPFVEEITGHNPRTYRQFAEDHAEAFR